MSRREGRPRLGDYVLVAQLSEDLLGTVYRAIHVRDGRFARLRVLESPELSSEALRHAMSHPELPHRRRSFYPPGRRETLSVADGRPFLAWHETSGWTLDTVLDAVRRRGAPIPIDGALRIAIGVAAALEHARANSSEGEPSYHGLLWPGFVTISRNAEVWVRGFGLARVVFPALAKPGLSRLVGPYVAPEVRSNGALGEQSDIYAVGVLLAQLLTAREATPEGPPELAPEDLFSEDVARLARSMVAEPAARPRSIRSVRLRLQKLLEDCPYERSSVDLALDLDDLMRPEEASRVLSMSRLWRSPRAIGSRPSEPGATRRVWALRIVASLAAVAVLTGVDLALRHREPSRAGISSRVRTAVLRATDPTVWQPSSPPRSAAVVVASESLSDSPDTPFLSKPRPSRRSSRTRQQETGAQLWRLRAALSRVAAEWMDAPALATEPFLQAKNLETKGEKLLARRRLAAAQQAFERAMMLYIRAEELCHQERARAIRVSFNGELSQEATRF